MKITRRNFLKLSVAVPIALKAPNILASDGQKSSELVEPDNDFAIHNLGKVLRFENLPLYYFGNRVPMIKAKGIATVDGVKGWYMEGGIIIRANDTRETVVEIGNVSEYTYTRTIDYLLPEGMEEILGVYLDDMLITDVNNNHSNITMRFV